MQTKRLTVRQIVKHIKSNIPDEYSEEEKIAYIVTEFSKRIASSEHYYFGDKSTKQQMIELAQRPYLGKKNDVKRKLIPFTMSEKLARVLEKCGYSVSFVKSITGKNKSQVGKKEILKEPASDFVDRQLSLLVKGHREKKGIELNIFQDLYKIQTRCKPMLFGQNVHCDIQRQTRTISRDSIEKVFRKVYGLKDAEIFTDEYIDFVVQRMKKEGKTPVEILKELINDERIQEEAKTAGCVEAHRFYQMLLRSIYCKGFGVKQWNASTPAKEYEFQLNKDATLIDECVLNSGKKKRYSFCIYAENDNEQVLFVYSKKEKKMVQLSPRDIVVLSGRSSHIKLRQCECDKPLRQSMKNYIQGIPKDAEKQSDVPQITIEDIFEEEEK